MMIIVEWARTIGVSGFIDLTVMTVLIYSILVWMRRTKRAAAIITGILIVAVVFLLARQFNLLLTAAILQGFFAVILVAKDNGHDLRLGLCYSRRSGV